LAVCNVLQLEPAVSAYFRDIQIHVGMKIENTATSGLTELHSSRLNIISVLVRYDPVKKIQKICFFPEFVVAVLCCIAFINTNRKFLTKF
jgi:hypothetical protein